MLSVRQAAPQGRTRLLEKTKKNHPAVQVLQGNELHPTARACATATSSTAVSAPKRYMRAGLATASAAGDLTFSLRAAITCGAGRLAIENC